MLKEYLSKAVSLLMDAVLGKPLQARAACPPGGSICTTFYGNCLSCGADKKKRGYCWCYSWRDPCCEWVDCVSC